MLGFLGNFRDLKAALTSGMILLVAVWLAVGNELVATGPSDSILGNLKRMADYLGPLPTVAALSFVAYLIGIVASLDSAALRLARKLFTSERQMNLARERLARVVQRRVEDASRSEHPAFLTFEVAPERLDHDQRQRLTRYKEQRADGDKLTHFDDDLFGDRADIMRSLTEGILAHIAKEMDLLALRVAAKHESAYLRYEKAHAEADFRASPVIPMFILGIVVVWRLFSEQLNVGAVVAGVLMLTGCILLARKAVIKQREAEEVLVSELVLEQVEVDDFAKLKALVDAAQAQNSQKA